MFLAKEKSVYETLSMLKGKEDYFGYFWAPLEQQKFIFERMSSHLGTRIERFDKHSITPPTYFKTSEVTSAFQQIVDTYGIPSYKEANPAIISIVTFPFLFGMMFGDLGHGSIMFSLGAFLVMMNDSLKKSRF